MGMLLVGLIFVFASLVGAAGMFVGLAMPRTTLGRIIATATLTLVGFVVGFYLGIVGMGGSALYGFTWFGHGILMMPFTGAVVFFLSLLFSWRRAEAIGERSGDRKNLRYP